MRNRISYLSSIKLLPLTLFLTCGQVLLAVENSEINEQFCQELATAKITVKRCILQPDTSKLVRCSNFMQKKSKSSKDNEAKERYLHLANLYDKRASKAWDIGTNIMLSKKAPNSKKQICSYYLDCFKKFVEDLPVFAPDGRDARVEQYKIRQEYGKLQAMCATGAYTITTGIRKVTERSPDKRYMGKHANLNNITEKESKQVIFINSRSGKITNVPLFDYAESKTTKEKYVFDSHQCLYSVKKEYEQNKHINPAPVYVFPSDNKGEQRLDMPFNKKTELNFKISGVEPIIHISWHKIANYEPKFHKASTYIAKNSLREEISIDSPKHRAVLKVARHLTNKAKDLCDIQHAEEFFTGTIELQRSEKISYDYDIDFRPAYKFEIKEAKKIKRRMENWSGSRTINKEIYDSLNNTLYAPAYVYKKRGTPKKVIKPKNKIDTEEPNWVEKEMAEELLKKVEERKEKLLKEQQEIRDNMSVDDLEMFTK